ncbi:hypothetical protein ABIA33_004001 [Streptacidiphilus sp. MAP12-16]|uniref:hypothetical protein n=1 Tax=Streptacidiphilus sp. MAP12-16 TaxID=3156300 RepID=UPI00351734B7
MAHQGDLRECCCEKVVGLGGEVALGVERGLAAAAGRYPPLFMLLAVAPLAARVFGGLAMS